MLLLLTVAAVVAAVITFVVAAVVAAVITFVVDDGEHPNHKSHGQLL